MKNIYFWKESSCIFTTFFACCSSFAVVLDTNKWFHATHILGDELSVVIGSEYDWCSSHIIAASSSRINQLWFHSTQPDLHKYLIGVRLKINRVGQLVYLFEKALNVGNLNTFSVITIFFLPKIGLCWVSRTKVFTFFFPYSKILSLNVTRFHQDLFLES